MRLLLLFVLLLTALSSSVLAQAEETDVPADLLSADYMTIEGVRAALPFGELEIDHGVIASFRGLDRRMAGILIGEAEAVLDELPEDNVINRFANKQRVRFEVERAYLSTSPVSDAKVLPGGRTTALRRWEQLSKQEQAQFLDTYQAAHDDRWGPGEISHDPQTGEKIVPERDPVDKEFFAAFWAEPVKLGDGQDPAPGTSDPRMPGGLVRYDFRVNATGDQVTITDQAIVLHVFQSPAPTLAPTAVP